MARAFVHPLPIFRRLILSRAQPPPRQVRGPVVARADSRADSRSRPSHPSRRRATMGAAGQSSQLSALHLRIARLVRSRNFVAQVTKLVKWPYVRFTGVVFTRSKVDDDTPDGIPADMSKWQNRPDIAIIDVPPGIVARAQKQTSPATSSSPPASPPAPLASADEQWCALFELYGQSGEVAGVSQDILSELDADIDKQLVTWSDRRHSLRTETDLHNSRAPEIFHEDHLSYIA